MTGKAAAETGSFPWLSPWRFSALLGILLFAAFPKVMLGQHSFFFRDYGVLGYPFVFYHHESFWRGELPFWNPLSNCGAPFLAQWGTMALYPFSLIYLVLPLPWSLGYFCLAHLFLAGLGMYFLAREWTRNDFAAAFAGVAFVFNGATFSSLIWPNYTVALGWMPWVVLCTQLAWREGNRKIVIAALVGALQMLSGVPELVILTWMVVGALWMTESATQKTFRQSLPRLASTVALIAGLCAAQLLPFIDLLAHSQRSTDFATSKWAMPGWGWANFLVPSFHIFKTYQGPSFQHEQGFMTSYYPGITLVLLAVWAAWRVRTIRVWVLGFLVLFSWIMALGENGFVYTWMKRCVPAMGFARFPVKFVFLSTFILPLLGAISLTHLPAALREKRAHSLFFGAAITLGLIGALVWFARLYPYPLQRWDDLWSNSMVRGVLFLMILGACCVALLVAQPRHRMLAACAALLLHFIDARTHTEEQNPTIPATWFAKGLWQQRNNMTARRVFISQDAEQRLLRSTVRDPLHDFIGKRLALWSNLNVVDGIPKVNGSSTLQLREQQNLERSLYPTNSTTPLPDGILDFLGVSHITGSNTVEWMTRHSALPLVTAGQKPVFIPARDELRAVLADNFDPRTIVCLPQEIRSAVLATNRATALIKDLRFGSQRISFTVSADQPAIVVIAQSYYHSWTARANGKPLPLWRANYAFQGLQVPAGNTEVVLTYRDKQFTTGAGISGAAALLCIVLWRRPSRRTSETSETEKKAPEAG